MALKIIAVLSTITDLVVFTINLLSPALKIENGVLIISAVILQFILESTLLIGIFRDKRIAIALLIWTLVSFVSLFTKC